MHDRLFANQDALGLKDLPQHARALGLNVPEFQKCLDGGKHAGKIRSDQADGAKAGVTGTPTFFIGVAQEDGRIRVLRKLPGAQPFAAFKTTIDALMASSDATKWGGPYHHKCWPRSTIRISPPSTASKNRTASARS